MLKTVLNNDIWAMLSKQNASFKHDFGIWCAEEIISHIRFKKYKIPEVVFSALQVKRDWLKGSVPESELQKQFHLVHREMIGALSLHGSERNAMMGLLSCARANTSTNAHVASQCPLSELVALGQVLYSTDIPAFEAATKYLKQKGQ